MPPAVQLQIYPSRVLRQKAKPIDVVNDDVRAVIAKMFEIMDEEEGIGLAAPQVGLAWRLFVLDVPENPKRGSLATSDPPSASAGRMVFINPVLRFEGAVEPMEEGCLSLPDIAGEVLRPPIVHVTALDENGKSFSLTAGGLLSRCIQHETDHLDGVLIIDKMTQPARVKNRLAVKKLEQG
ncbi:MAG: peptide deformylase [Phycisphaerae bacterium]|jgi:peptide deformylase